MSVMAMEESNLCHINGGAKGVLFFEHANKLESMLNNLLIDEQRKKELTRLIKARQLKKKELNKEEKEFVRIYSIMIKEEQIWG